MLFLEIFLSIHCLLLVSSWVVGGHWLLNQPSFKLKLARFLLISCVISPLMVHCINTNQKMEPHHYASIDALQEYVNQPILKSKHSEEITESATSFSISNTSYFHLFYIAPFQQ